MDRFQFAFSPNEGQGTDCALTLISHCLLSGLDQPGAMRVLLLDFRKAFDLVLRSRILSALAEFEVPREIICWIYDYLTERQQRVSYNGSVSGWRNILSGVPQGSILGPLLFAVVIDSLRPSHPNVEFIKYADDITALFYIRHPEDDCINNELFKILEWVECRRFQVNWDKTHILNYTTTSKFRLAPVISPSGVCLQEVNCSRILGVTFSNDLRWDSHLDGILKRARRNIGLICLLTRTGCSPDWCWTVYNSLIRSLLTLGFAAWCNLPKTLFSKMCRIEKRVETIIGFPPRSSLPMFLDSLCTRLARKIIKCEAHPLRRIFHFRTPDSSARNLRRRCKTSRLKNSFTRFGRPS